MENVRIAILDSRDAVMAGMDNLLPDALHYYNDELHEYLKGAASTYRFTTNAKHPDSLYIVEGAKIAFVYRGKDYYFNIMQVERNEFEVTAECYFTSFELLNEYVPAYSSNGPKSFEEYLVAFDPERTVTLGINEVSDKRISNEWTGDDTVLARLFSVASLFDAEIEFEAKLNDDYSLGQIVMNVYREHSDTNQGMGLRRNDICLRYGKNVTGVKKTSDVLQLYTGIRPYGRDGLTIEGIDRKEHDDAGRVEFETSGTNIYAPLARDRFPSNLWNANDGYIFMVKNYDTDNKEKLYSMALSALKENCVPKVQYDIEGYFDSGIGDTFDVTDEEYNPTLYLQARVTEQIRSFTDPKTNKTVFSNFKELQPEIDPELIKRMNALIEANKVYVCNLITDNGVVFKNNTGETTLQPSVMDGSKDVTQNFRYRWTKDGTFLKESATLKVTAEGVDGKAVYKYEAIDSYDNVKGFYEVTITDVEDGKPGESGKSFYTWIKFADDEHGNGMSDAPDGKQYLGIAYNKETPEKSENPKDYAWARITGEGIPGAPGEDGKTYYTWVRYADNEHGSGMSDTPDGKAYIGFAFNKETQTESNNPADYKWSKIKGDDGAEGKPGKPGEPGKDGKGIESIIEYYLTSASNSGITTSSYGWSTEIPTMTPEKKYLWNYEEIQYNDGTTEKKTPKIIGAYGNTGEEGVGIKNIVNYYLATSLGSGVTTSTYGWTTTKQDMTETKRYLWNYEVITYTNGTRYQSPLTIIGVYGQTGEPGKNNLIVSPTAPENPVVGQLWQTASGDAIKRWDGKQWVMHYLSVDNLKADVLSAITANLGEITAGILKNLLETFVIDVTNGTITSKASDLEGADEMALRQGALFFSGSNLASDRMTGHYMTYGMVFKNITGDKGVRMLYDNGDLWLNKNNKPNDDPIPLHETLERAKSAPVVLARCVSTSFQQFAIEDYQHFRYLILISGARMGSTLYRPLAECTVHPEIFLHCNSSNGGAIACYAEEPGNYRAELMAVDATTIRLRCKSSFDMAVLLGVR